MGTSSSRGVAVSRMVAVFLLFLALYLLQEKWYPRSHRHYADEGVKTVEPYSTPVLAAPSTSLTVDEPLEEIDYGGQVSVEPTMPPQATSTGRIQHDDDSMQLPEQGSPRCRPIPGAEKVMVILKTGATELYQKLPVHFLTTFKCIPHFMIFSDLEQSCADYSVLDAIAPVSQHYREQHADFELYRKLKQYQREGQDMGSLKGDVSWNLDKWKFFPMMHKAFTEAEDEIEWFVIIEADTSLSWTNLLQWLGTMDPKEPLYLGAQNVIGSTTFAHGGSGIIISRAAADKLEELRTLEGQETYDARWEEDTSRHCCGDEIIARAFLEANIHLTPSWPLIQGETVASLDWTHKHWCTPPISWHHVSAIELDGLWQFEQAWIDGHGWNQPYLYRDVFVHFIERHVGVNRTNWNNMSKDRRLVNETLATDADEAWSALLDFEQAATESAEACAEACARQMERDCVQWMFSPGRCYLGREIRFGKSDEREDEHWTSGWVQQRLDEFKEVHLGCTVSWSGWRD